MHRTALITVIALSMVLGATAPVAAQSSPARVAPPMTFDDLDGDAESGTVLLEEGTRSIAASVTRGSIEVWTKRVPCVSQDEGTCVDGRASTNRYAVDASGGTVSVTPREGDRRHLTGVIAGTPAELSYAAERARLDLVPEDEVVELSEDGQAPQGKRQIELSRGAQLGLRDGINLSVEGAFQFNSVDSVINVQVNGSENERIVTGWTWEDNGGSMQYYHTLTLVRAKLDGALVAAWDGTARLAAELPMQMSAHEAQVDVDEGSLGEATAESGNTTLQDVDLTVTGIAWNQQASQEAEQDPWEPLPDEPAAPVSSGEASAQQEGDPPAGWFLVELGLDSATPPSTPQESGEVSTTAIVSASAATLAVAGLAAYYWPRLSWLGTVVLLPMYSRIEKDEILENEVRETLYELVQDDPGIHAHALSEEADVGWGTTVYHLRRLERNGFVTSEKKGRYRRFFPAAGYLARQREVLSVLQNETTNDIARVILKEPGLNQKAICEELDISPSLANWHINRLMDADLVERERRGRTVHYTPGPAWRDIKDAIDLDMDEAAFDEAVTA